MKIKLQTILIMAFLLALPPAYAQHAGGDGRGDFALTATGLKILSCSNPTNGGTIGTAQQICTGSTPAAFTSLTLPSDYNGVLTYKWQYATVADSTSFTDIANTDSVAYAPGTLTATTWYRRLSRVSCKADWTGATSSNVVKIIVAPTTVGGTVTGGQQVCYGSNRTLLTLSGHTGSVQKWQYSTDTISWTDITHTTDTLTAINLTEDKYYRAVVKSGECSVENSAKTRITMFTNYKISGYAKYDNNPKTPLSGLSITLKRGDTVVGTPYITGTTGYYQFQNLVNGTYKLDIKSAHPTGNWQTWSGVNNTDYLLALRHATTGPLLPANPPVVRISGDVKLPKTPPEITTVDADAIRMAAKYGWGPVNKPYFDIPKWVFSGLNADNRIDSIVMTCGNLTRDIRGLCAGDVNGSYLPPNGYKMAEPSLELVNRGTLPITPEIIFPVRAERDMELGAITLMLDYDASLIQITGVEMPENGGVEPWFEVQSSKFKVQGSRFEVQSSKFEVGATPNLEPGTSNLLTIGWASLNPINVPENGTVLLIHTRLPDPASSIRHPASGIQHPVSSIRFTLNESPLSELADGEGNVIDGAKLSVADAGSNGKTVRWQNGKVVCYPNPAHSTLNIELETPSIGTLNLELVNLQGVSVITLEPVTVAAGWHKEQLDLRGLAPGVYFLRANLNGELVVRKVIISR